MIRNYLKIAIRNLLKQRVYSVINIVGLCVGLASCLLILLFVQDEFSYDKFHTNADRIYKVALERKYPTHATFYAIIPHSYADAIAKDFPEVETVTRMGGPFNNLLVSYENQRGDKKQFEENNVMSADSSFFNVFSVKLLKGYKESALLNPNDMVITEETAKRYFGNEDPMGKTMTTGFGEFKITGVSENIPDNSHFKFDFLFSWNSFQFGRQINYISFSAHTYVLMKPGADAPALEEKFPKMVDTYAAAQIERDLGKSWADYKREGNGYRYFLQPLTSIHLDPTNIEAKMKPGGNLNYVYFLISIAVLIVTIACINFMNLSTARSAERAREVGVRKTMGSKKGQLIFQFLVESILISLLAMTLALVVTNLLLPAFNDLTGKALEFTFSPVTIALMLAFALGVGALAGSYPAFFLSAFNPVVVMKGNFSGQAKGAWLRNGLVVFQFFISIVLIVGTIVVNDQMTYMRNKALGYNHDNIVVIERANALNEKSVTFMEEARRIPNVVGVGGAFSLLGRQQDFFGSQFTPEGSDEVLTTKSMVIDDDFVEMVGFEILEGKSFSRETNDTLSIMLNEAAVKVMGIKDPIGKKLVQVQRNANGAVMVPYTIVGIIGNFNFQSLRDEITPLTILSNESFGGGLGYSYVRVKGNETQAALGALETLWHQFAPDQPFKYVFMDQHLQNLYESEKRAGEVFGVFAGIAIVIACVGLFGLAAYTANLRTKEIGVRKVMGASVMSVVYLLSKDFTKLIAIAFVLSIPVGWYLMDQWLSNFAYRIDISAATFLIAGVTALLISWLTVSYQSIKAAIVNPVKSLRSE